MTTQKTRPHIKLRTTVRTYANDEMSVEKINGKWFVKDAAGAVASKPYDSEQDAKAACSMMKDKGGVWTEHAEIANQHSNIIKGVEVFSSGTHNGDEYSEKDLDDIVSAFSELDYRPALKVGHTKDTPGAPAYGWVQNLKRVGNKLVADFTDMHDSVVDAIRKKAYNNVSSEIYFNLKRGGKDFRRALKAVALLGAEVPAVSGLTPLHKMEFAETGFDGIAVCEQALDVPAQAVVDALSERVAGLVTLIKEYDMSKNAEKIKALQEQVAKFNADMDELKKKKVAAGADDDEEILEDEDIKKLSEQAEAIGDQIAELEADDAADTANTDQRIAELSEQLAAANEIAATSAKQTKELSERMAKIEGERRSAEVGTRVKACKIPAFRDGLGALYSYALASGASATVKVYSKDADGKDVSADKTLIEVVDGMVGQINDQAEKLFKALAYTGKTVREDGNVEDQADAEVNRRVNEYREKHPEVKEYAVAMTAVLKSDPGLAQRYRDQLGDGQ